MHTQFDTNQGAPPLYKQLRQAILATIAAGEVGPGQKIRSVRELTRIYGVSHITVRRCLADLVAEGVLVARRGRGTYVADSPARSKSIALVIPGEAGKLRSSPYHSPILAGVLEGTEHHGLRLTTVFGDNGDVADRLGGVDGVIFFYVRHGLDLGPLRRSGAPVVLVDWEDREGAFHSVSIDNQGGGFKAMKHLVSLGHRDVLVLTENLGSRNYAERLEGCATAAGSFDLPWRPEMVLSEDRHYEGGYASVMAAIERGLTFTAVLALDDCLAVGAMSALAESSRRVPEDVSVIGFGSYEFHNPPRPRLTTIEVPKGELGRAAVDRLAALMTGGGGGGRGGGGQRNMIIPVGLLERNSTARPSPVTGTEKENQE